MNISPLYKLRIFSLNDIMQAFGMTRPAAASALLRWQQQDVIQMIRRDMYTVIDNASGSALVDKYEIATRISPTSYVGWHTALEFHGLAHQPFFTACVGSYSRFNPFCFGGIDYYCCTSSIIPTEENGVVTPVGNPYVRVTDLERTIVDCCDQPDKAGGIEELQHCLEGVTLLDEKRLLHYLSAIGKAVIYQKTGFMLETFCTQAHLSEAFYETCREMSALHTKYLTTDGNSDMFITRWRLYVPHILINQTLAEDDII